MPDEDIKDDVEETKNDESVVTEGVPIDALAECELRVQEYKAGWQRAMADYKNLQREISERRGELIRQSELTILEEFIPVWDNFKKAFAHKPATGSEEQKWQNWAQGIEYIGKQFGDVVKGHAVEEIKTVGEHFDPNLHDAMGEEESELAEGTIIREMDAGYTMNGKVIKPAKVIISKNS